MAFMISSCDFMILSDFLMQNYFEIPISLRKLELKNNENLNFDSKYMKIREAELDFEAPWSVVEYVNVSLF